MTNIGHDHFGGLRDFVADFNSFDRLVQKAEAHQNHNPLKSMNYLGRAYKKLEKRLDIDKQKGMDRLNSVANNIEKQFESKLKMIHEKMNESAKKFCEERRKKQQDGLPPENQSRSMQSHENGNILLEPGGSLEFRQPLLSNSEPISQSSEQPLTIKERVDCYMDTINSSRKLTQKWPLINEEMESIRGQLTKTLEYLDENRDSLVEKARNSTDGYIYLRPSDQGGKKSGEFKRYGSYTHAHLQVCSDGGVFIIPKHQELKLGEGSYKRVCLGLEEKSGKIVAAASVRSVDLQELQKEIRLIKKNQKNVAYMTYTHPMKQTKGKIILPYAQYGDLSNVISTPLMRDKFKKGELALGMIESVRDQHNAGIIVRDLKLQNFLLAEEEGQPRVWSMDLGLSTLVQDSGIKDMSMGNPFTLAPECFNPTKDSKRKVDIYALGITLWHFYHNFPMDQDIDPLPWFSDVQLTEALQSPYVREKHFNNYKKNREEYLDNHPEFNLPADGKPKTIKQLVAWMTEADPSHRPTIEQVEHAFKNLPIQEKDNPDLPALTGWSASKINNNASSTELPYEPLNFLPW